MSNIEIYISNFDTQASADVSSTLQLLPMSDPGPLSDFSAAACIFMKTSHWNNLFVLKVQSDSVDIQDISSEDILYTLDVSNGALVNFIKEVKYLNAGTARLDCSVNNTCYYSRSGVDASYSSFFSSRKDNSDVMEFVGIENVGSNKKLVAQDYVRYLAQSVLQNVDSADLFGNESKLRGDIQLKGMELWRTIINSLVADISLNDANYTDVNSSESITAKIFTSFTRANRINNSNILDFSGETPLEMRYFQSGDVITTSFTINSTTHNPTGNNSVTPSPRTYKIKLCLVEDNEFVTASGENMVFYNTNIHGNDNYTVGGVVMNTLSDMSYVTDISYGDNLDSNSINWPMEVLLSDISGEDAVPYGWKHNYNFS